MNRQSTWQDLRIKDPLKNYPLFRIIARSLLTTIRRFACVMTEKMINNSFSEFPQGV